MTATVTDRPSPTVAERRGGDLRAVLLLWRREMQRLRRTPLRLVMSLVTPLMFLVVFANGLDATSGADTVGMRSYRSYLYPGVLLMCIQAPAVSLGVSLVWDRQRGVLRQMLTAPIKRSSIVWGLALGGATIGVLYAIPVLSIAGYAGIPYDWHLLAALAQSALIALAFTTIGLVFAVTIRSVETFQTVLSLSMTPMMFLSGAMFPPGVMDGWMGLIIKINPITYMVDALRRTLSDEPYGGDPQAALHLFGWIPPVWAELGALAVVAALGLTFAARRFGRDE